MGGRGSDGVRSSIALHVDGESDLGVCAQVAVM